MFGFHFARRVLPATRQAVLRPTQHIKSNCGYGVRTKTKVAVLGGAFDPPTNGHLQLATEIAQADDVDEVWLAPCGPRC